jgi:hypothetical protein
MWSYYEVLPLGFVFHLSVRQEKSRKNTVPNVPKIFSPSLLFLSVSQYIFTPLWKLHLSVCVSVCVYVCVCVCVCVCV